MNRLKPIKEKKGFKLYFEVSSILGIPVSTTKSYWDIITHIKHPTLNGKEEKVKETLIRPDEIRISRRTKDVLLFYRRFRLLYLCVVVKILRRRGFIITAYFTDKIKEGQLQWKR